ncbi:hypothetical protein VKT23_014350 [Stygiomarasmius scandens]|uniref:Uncharacterized protein n=1 Tax=Marasmiellus scandens TaxID=2682957 RepID=A0ABR1J0N0_9AGAR
MVSGVLISGSTTIEPTSVVSTNLGPGAPNRGRGRIIARESNPPTQGTNTGIIIGRTLGGISFIIAALCILRQRRKMHREKSSQNIDVVPFDLMHNTRIARNKRGMAEPGSESTHIPGHGHQQLSESDSTLTARQQNIRIEANDQYDPESSTNTNGYIGGDDGTYSEAR